ncbi:MAG: UbiA-like polyprenyltransferase [Tepidisphaerales bacterium]
MSTPSSNIAAPSLHPATRRLALFAADIKISHTIFAMPFALLSTFLAACGWPKGGQLLLIVLCMICARTVAMAMNRLLDARLDALNPRTFGRAIPAGALSRGFFVAAVVLCSVAFMAATSGFWFWYRNAWPVTLSLPVLAFLSAYPLLKRFTRLCHYYLGAALALAPVCAWVAIRGDMGWPPLVMAAAVLLWTAGFDIIYACQDYQSDVQTGVLSVPAKLGISRALCLARLTHVGSAAMLLLLGRVVPQFGLLYHVGAALAITLLVVEHTLVKADDLSKVGLAFFTINGIISVILGTLGILDVFF